MNRLSCSNYASYMKLFSYKKVIEGEMIITPNRTWNFNKDSPFKIMCSIKQTSFFFFLQQSVPTILFKALVIEPAVNVKLATLGMTVVTVTNPMGRK